MDTRAATGLVSGVVLTVLGAILFYAVTADVTGVDLNAVGAILMVAGIALAAFGLLSGITAAIKDRTTRVEHVDERSPQQTVVERETR